jgi:hypothetical protein
MMVTPVSVKALPDYRIWIRYDDGLEGEVDLSHLAGKGVFAFWNDYHDFEKVSIGASGEILWGRDIDLCPDAIYLKLSGKPPEALFPSLGGTHVNA